MPNRARPSPAADSLALQISFNNATYNLQIHAAPRALAPSYSVPDECPAHIPGSIKWETEKKHRETQKHP
jgi:hypothetical protein